MLLLIIKCEDPVQTIIEQGIGLTIGGPYNNPGTVAGQQAAQQQDRNAQLAQLVARPGVADASYARPAWKVCDDFSEGCVLALHLVLSNSAARLSAELKSCLSAEGRDPLDPPAILIQAHGMERYLNLCLAGSDGATFGIQYLFPNRLVQCILSGLEQVHFPFDKEAARFALQALLLEDAAEAASGALADYPGDGPDQARRRDQLAGALAEVFDQYLSHRPDWMLADRAAVLASQPPIEDLDWLWQRRLWEKLIQRYPEFALPDRLQQWQALHRAGQHSAPFTGNLYCFAISYLPEIHLRILVELAQRRDVHLFTLSPGLPDFAAQSGAIRLRDFLQRLSREKFSSWRWLDDAQKRPLSPLHQIAAAMEGFAITPHGEGDPLHLSRRVQLHSCHTPLREVEALQLWLLQRFQEDSSLRASDVLVMAPDINRYAPALQAVFRKAGSASMPISVADRTAAPEREGLELLLAALQLPGERYRAGLLTGLLQHPLLAQQFGYRPELVDEYVAAAHIRWGADRNFRQSRRPANQHPGSWREGLDRLLLAWSTEQAREGSPPLNTENIRELAAMAAAVDAILDSTRGMEELLSAATWTERLLQMIEALLPAYPQRLAIERAITRFKTMALRLQPSLPLSVDCISAYLRRFAVESAAGKGFMSGGIAACTMMPMRNVPFRIVCLLGMDESSFPRGRRTISFHLLQRYPRAGDPSRRLEDRLLFMEALLAAGDWLYLSYCGQDAAGAKLLRGPSTLIDELSTALGANDGQTLLDRQTLHPLYAWDRRYFISGRLPGDSLLPRGTSPRLLEAARSVTVAGPRRSAQIVPGNSARKTGANLVGPLNLGQLLDALRNPAARYLRNIGLRLSPADRLSEKPGSCREWEQQNESPWRADPLQQYALRGSILHWLISGKSVQDAVEDALIDAALPAGWSGRQIAQQLCAEAQHLLAAAPSGMRATVLKLSRHIGDALLEDELPVLEGDGRLLLLNHGAINARRIVESCLIYSAAGCEGDSYFFSRESEASMLRIRGQAGEDLLRFAVQFYHGLEQEFSPLFLKSSLRYYQSIQMEGADRRSAQQKALACYLPSFTGAPGEGQTPELRLLFPDLAPLAESSPWLPQFEELALRFWSLLSQTTTLPELWK
ncbi:MAG: exodeoxyribonuclease V subunit gamma [Leptospirales bacterium]|nr:exodeoxyribonuclease V subunit gamma [Leptospirales bacterium]